MWFPQSHQAQYSRLGTMVKDLPFLRYEPKSDCFVLNKKYVSKKEFQNTFLTCPICLKGGTQPQWPFWRCLTCRKSVCSQHVQTLDMKRAEGDCDVCCARIKDLNKTNAADDNTMNEAKRLKLTDNRKGKAVDDITSNESKPKVSRVRDPNQFPTAPWNDRWNWMHQ